MDDLTRSSLWYLKLLVFQCLGDFLGWGILGDPVAVSRDDAIFLGERIFQGQKPLGTYPYRTSSRNFFWPISGTNTKISETGTVRVTSQGLFCPWNKLSPINIASSRLAAPEYLRGWGWGGKMTDPGNEAPDCVTRNVLEIVAITFIRCTCTLLKNLKPLAESLLSFPTSCREARRDSANRVRS